MTMSNLIIPVIHRGMHVNFRAGANLLYHGETLASQSLKPDIPKNKENPDSPRRTGYQDFCARILLVFADPDRLDFFLHPVIRINKNPVIAAVDFPFEPVAKRLLVCVIPD